MFPVGTVTRNRPHGKTALRRIPEVYLFVMVRFRCIPAAKIETHALHMNRGQSDRVRMSRNRDIAPGLLSLSRIVASHISRTSLVSVKTGMVTPLAELRSLLRKVQASPEFGFGAGASPLRWNGEDI